MKSINTLKQKENFQRWYAANKDLPEFKERQRHALLKWREEFPEKYLWQRAKYRSAGITFDIEVKDVKIPEVCPVFKTPFVYNTPYAASLDRIDNSKGYVKGNIQVISRKANAMKRDASDKELKDFAQWVLKQSQH